MEKRHLVSEKPSNYCCGNGELEKSFFESHVFKIFGFENLTLSDESTPSPLIASEMKTLKALLIQLELVVPLVSKLANTEANYELMTLHMLPFYSEKELKPLFSR